MSIEKRGVIDENTPQVQSSGELRQDSEPGTKEAADKLQGHPINDMIDAVVSQTRKHQ